ncbi:MAG: hypothetical protein JXR88_18790 [Clostridia bacterium]|nr:hypothetical protein [Clostridia bacterium]
MKKKKILLAIVILLLFTLMSCEKDTNSDNGMTNQNEVQENTLDSTSQVNGVEPSEPVVNETSFEESPLLLFENAMKESGLTIENRNVKEASMIGALEGWGWTISGLPIEGYVFDLNSNDANSIANVEQVQNEHLLTYYNVEVNGETPVSLAEINGNLVIVFPMEDMMKHPKKDEILEILRNMSF